MDEDEGHHHHQAIDLNADEQADNNGRPVHHSDSSLGQIIKPPDHGLLELDSDGHQSSGNEDDLFSLLFWFRGDDPVPIYTLDARQVLLPDKLADLEVAGGPSLSPAPEGRLKGARRPPRSAVNATGPQRRRRRPRHRTESGSDQSKLIRMANERLISQATHYPGSLGGAQLASRLVLDSSPDQFPLVRLRIEPVQAADTATYKCRVDFRRSRTVSQVVRLLVKGEQSVSLVGLFVVHLFVCFCWVAACPS